MKKFLHENGILLVIIAVLLAALLWLGAYLLGADPISGIINTLGAPFRSVSTAVSDWTAERYDRTFRWEQMENELDRLRRRVAELEENARNGSDAMRENERLRNLLGLSTERPELVFVDAAVTRRGSSNWSSDLTLNKGSLSDVAVSDCVIDQYGNLIGIVTEVGPNWSLVTTLLDPDTQVGGRVSRIDENAILEGDFTLMQEGRLKLSYLSADSMLISGDQITTSGLGGLYPSGLTVGTLRSLHTEPDGISRYGVVEPSADINNVRYVYIITDFGGES